MRALLIIVALISACGGDDTDTANHPDAAVDLGPLGAGEVCAGLGTGIIGIATCADGLTCCPDYATPPTFNCSDPVFYCAEACPTYPCNLDMALPIVGENHGCVSDIGIRIAQCQPGLLCCQLASGGYPCVVDVPSYCVKPDDGGICPPPIPCSPPDFGLVFFDAGGSD